MVEAYTATLMELLFTLSFSILLVVKAMICLQICGYIILKKRT